jgi:hypothetical protein
MGSIRKPTSPMCSLSWSICGPLRVSTSSCPGRGRPNAPPINAPPDAPNLAEPSQKNQANKAVGAEDRLRCKSAWDRKTSVRLSQRLEPDGWLGKPMISNRIGASYRIHEFRIGISSCLDLEFSVNDLLAIRPDWYRKESARDGEAPPAVVYRYSPDFPLAVRLVPSIAPLNSSSANRRAAGRCSK